MENVFEKLALHITCWLEKYKVIKQDEIVVVKWGIKNILDTIFNVTTFLIIGILMGMITETVFFTIGYIPLRSYAGGYHAKTPFRCWIVSSLILFIAMNMICSLKNFSFAFVVLAVISVFILILLMPVSDIHKPLNENDKLNYKIKGIVILSIEILISIMFFIIGWVVLTYSFFSIWILLTIMLILGEIKNKINKNVQ